MTPAARLQAVIDILDWLGRTDQPVDRFLRDWFRARRYAGSKDRRDIAERIFQIERRRASLAWRMESDSPRALVIAALLGEGADPETVFTGDGYDPAVLTPEERARIAAPPREAPLFVQGEFPAFLEDELTRAFGGALLDEMQAFAERAPVDLRVNTLKANRGEVLAALAAEGFAAVPTPTAPHGIRVPAGASGLDRTALFLAGAYEFQDESAQIASLLCGARPGMRVLDLASGAGGKALAFAADMENRGEIVAGDLRASALAQLSVRAARAGADIIQTRLSADAPPEESFDRVFVDAPCSGSGTWRRQPELKNRLTPSRLTELTALQDRLLDEGAACIGQGGHLIYATCSILPCENEDRIAAFLARTPGFAVLDAASIWRAAVDKDPPACLNRYFRATPRATGSDGFFCAILGRA